MGRSFSTTIGELTRAVVVLGGLFTLARALLPEESESEEGDEEEEEGDILLSPSWSSAQLLRRAVELRHHAWDLREEGSQRRATACAAEAEEWEAQGRLVRGEEEAGLRSA